MRKIVLNLSIFTFLATSMLSSNSYAEKPYLEKNRTAYIASVLRAFSKTKSQNLLNTYKYINVVDNNNCRSSLSDLRVECLLNFASKNCSEGSNTALRDNCQLYSDIIVVNKLSEKTFLSRTERYKLTKTSGYDFRTAITNRLRQKYARLVTQFSLSKEANCDSGDFDCLAKGIDQFCLNYTNSQSLSWQYCMSASLWFIGTSKKD